MQNDISEARLQAVKDAFHFLSNGNARVSLSDLKNRYQASKHPRTQAREKKESVVLQEFCDGISVYSEDGFISIEGFCNFYLD